MNAAWEAVYTAARAISPAGSLRITNLAIAAASRHASETKRSSQWNGRTAKQRVTDLALGPLPPLNDNTLAWTRLADLAYEAAYLGNGSAGMYSWAAAYQRTSTTQKQLGAYATHHAFANAIARIAINPIGKKKTLRIVDPSVGPGNLLLAAIELFAKGGTDRQVKQFVLNLYGMDIDPCARELCCLLLWLTGASCGVTLDQVARNIRVGNALTMDWWSDQDLFDVLLINPPWESLRHKVENDEGGVRAATLERLSKLQPGAESLPPLFSAQGSGDRNLFKAFVEMVPHLLVEGGRLGALLPAAFASDAGLTKLRERYFSQFEIAKWTSFENRARYFPIDSRYKFGILAATRSNSGTKKLWVRGFATEPDEVDAPHTLLQRKDIALIGRKYHIIPELSCKRELDILRIVLQGGSALFKSGTLGKVTYRREIDLCLAKDKFHHFTSKQLRPSTDGTFVDDISCRYVPLIEGRLVGAYDCFQKTWISGSGRKATWADNDCQPLNKCRPQYIIAPAPDRPPRVALCDVTAATNTRTVIATLVPATWRCGNTAPVLEFDSYEKAFAGLGVLNSMVFDWVARRLVSGLHLNKFILEGFVWPALTATQMNALAFATWSICISKPRSGLSGSELNVPPFRQPDKQARQPMPQIDANVAIELAVARGFGLTCDHLATLYDPDKSNRRGLWRHFDAEPKALRIARGVVRKLGLD